MISSKEHVTVVFIAGSFLFFIFVVFIVIYVLVYNRKQQKNKLERQKMIFEHNQALLQAHLDEQENTLNEISKDIHDNVIQKLSFAQMSMHVLCDELQKDNKSIGVRTSELLNQIADDLHNISHLSNTDYIKANGLVEVLRKEVEYINAGKKMQCRFHIDGEPIHNEPEKALLIYRFVQEATHNSLKHSGGTILDIRVQYLTEGLTVTISDNGVGFDINQAKKMKGIGLSNMYHRAKMLDDEINIESSAGKGCIVLLHIYLKSEFVS